MCQGRLAVGEAPACVQACPTHAIRIVTVTTHVQRREFAPTRPAFLAAAPDSGLHAADDALHLRKRALPENLAAADAATLRPQPPHWPLAVMLVLTPARGRLRRCGYVPIRTAAMRLWSGSRWPRDAGHRARASLHLGQPLKAWRCFLGWRKVWLSREDRLRRSVRFAPAAFAAALHSFRRWLPLAAAVGLLSVFCSVMVYVDTRRPLWRCAQTAPRFFGTALLGGAALWPPASIRPSRPRPPSTAR